MHSLETMSPGLAATLRAAAGSNPVHLRATSAFADWPSFDLPRRVGGADWSVEQMCLLMRRCGRVDLEMRDLAGGGHARLLTAAPTRRFDPFLTSVARGKAFCAIAITEPEAGSDLHALTTTATPSPPGYILNGRKQYISRIKECSHLIVFAAGPRHSRVRPLSAFLVPIDLAGIKVESMAPMGMATVSWGKVTFRDVQVPGDARIGGEGQALSLFMRHFSYWRLLMAAAAIGSGEAALDQAGHRLRYRSAFGGPIGRFTHLQQALAQHVAHLRMAWLLVESVARDMEVRPWPVFDSAMAKAEGVEAALAATDWAMTVLGAAGYDVETGLEKRHRDLLGMRIADGTTDLLRGQVARGFLGERLYELSLHRSDVPGFETDKQRRRYW